MTRLGGINSNTVLNSTEFTQTASVTVSNTVTETALTSTGVGSLTLAAAALTAGKAIRITASGYYSSDASAPGTLNIRGKLGSTTIAATGAQTVPSAAANRGWRLQLTITCRTTGGSGTVFAQGVFYIGSSATAMNSVQMVNTGTSTIDTTVTQAISVTAEWGTADSDNSLTCTNLVIEEL